MSLSLEQLYEKLEENNTKLETYIASTKTAMDDEEKTKQEAAKKAMDEKDEEEKEAKKASKSAALKKAMEEEDDDKRDAAIKKAMDMDEEHKHNANDDEEEKEHKAKVASIIADKKNEIINKILTASKIFNPTGLVKLESELKVASITEVEKHWAILAPAFEGATATPTQTRQQPQIPYYANMAQDIDKSQLTASSPDSEFNQFTTKQLLEMYQ